MKSRTIAVPIQHRHMRLRIYCTRQIVNGVGGTRRRDGTDASVDERVDLASLEKAGTIWQVNAVHERQWQDVDETSTCLDF